MAAAFGCKVTQVSDEGGADRVSVLSPMGTALLGARVGDMLEYEGATGPERARIADIVYQPEAAGHSFL